MTRNLLGWPTWIGLVVENLDVQRRFDRDTLGLPETDSAPGWVHFDLGGNLFELVQRDKAPQYDAARYQVGFTVEDIEAARQELLRLGVEPLNGIEPDEGADFPQPLVLFPRSGGKRVRDHGVVAEFQ